MKHLKLLNAVLAVMCILNEFKFAESHGRLMDPPSRSTLWRYSQFRDRAGVEINYSDTSLFCGGFSYQKSKGMRCGACGDPVDGPFKNEAGGKYARHKVISRCIPIGQKTMNVLAQVTANHKGFFEYRICPNNDFKKRVSLDCLNRNLLRVAGATGTGPDQYRHYIGGTKGNITTTVILPDGLTCTQCVLQWRYKTANSWGKCPNGKGGVGCGPQEEFYGCADIAILDDCTGVVDGSRDVTASDANKNTNGGGSNVGGNSWNDVPDNDEEIDCEEL